MHFRKFAFISIVFMGLPVWAASVPGIDNFYQIDQKVYRGAQPTTEGFHYLATLGVKVVLDLREHDSRSLAEERTVTAAGMKYINVPMTGMTPPTVSETNTILALLEDQAGGPVFVHCKRGADRTGAVIASYRIDHDRWDGAKALREAMAERMSGFQFQRQKFIRTFQGRPVVVASSKAEETTAVTDAAIVSPKPAVDGN
jgi:protein tyrosine phosphatase (PTP) superfamily phosphohydrolase (DUF442 family)